MRTRLGTLSVTNCQHFSNQSNCLIVADLSERVSVFVFPIVIVPATSPLGILESKIRSDDDVHMISVTSSSSRPMVYSSNLGSSRLSASTDDGTHKNDKKKIQVVT